MNGVGRLWRAVAAVVTAAVVVVGMPIAASAVGGATSIPDAPWMCAANSGGASNSSPLLIGSWAGTTVFTRTYVPHGATLTMQITGEVTPQSGGAKWSQMYVYHRLFEANGVSQLHRRAEGIDQTNATTSPVPMTGAVVTWTNNGSSRTIVSQLSVSLGLAGSGEASVDVSSSASPVGDPGCVDDRTKRGGGLESVKDAEDPVNTFTGAYTESRVDLAATAGLFGLDWVRQYDSGGTAGDPAWGFSFSDHLTQLGSGAVELTLPSSRVVVFEPDGLGGFERPVEFDGLLTVDGTGWRLGFSDGSATTFDSSGAMTSRESWDGQVVTAAYTSGRLSSLTSSVGPSLTMAYTSGRLTSVTASDGRVVSYTYDLNGFLTGATLPGSVTWSYTNDADGHVTKVEDPTGVDVVTLGYDTAGRVTSQTLAAGAQTTFVYDLPRSQVAVTDVATSTTNTYYYDGLGRLVTVEDEDGGTIERSYDEFDQLTGTQSRLGGSTTIDRNDRGLIVEITAPGRDPITIDYDGSNRVESVTDASGTTTYSYDGAERIPATVTDPESHTATFDVVDGLIESVTDADGVTVLYRYDSLRQLEETEDEYGNITTYDYDAVGRQTSVEKPSGATTLTGYDAAGRPDELTAADGGLTQVAYDGAGRVTSVTDPTLAVTTFAYDSDTGLLESMTDPMLRVTTYTHNLYGDLTRSTFEDTTSSETDYGLLRRVDATRDELGRETSYTYDADGNVASVEDPEGGVTTTDYDDAGRVTSVTDPGLRETTYDYEADTGLLQSVTSPAGTVTYTYDDLGRQRTVTDLRGATTETSYTPGGRVDWIDDGLDQRTDYTYDAAGRLASIEAPGGLVTEYGYDEDSRVEDVTSPGGLVTSATFDDAGRVLTSTDPAGVVTTNTWTLRGELASTTKSGEGTVEYSYNPDGTLDWVEDALNRRTTFGYDNRGRLETRTNPDSKVWSTDYNAAGELVSETDPLNRSTSYTYDGAGRLETTADPSGRTTTNTWLADGLLDGWSANDGVNTLAADFGYDAAGRRNSATIGTRTWATSFNAAGDVTSTTNPDGRVALFGYDAIGRRTSMRNPDGTAYTYAYDAGGRVDTITPTALTADTFTAANGSTADTSKWADVSSTGGTVAIDANKAELTVPNTSGATAGFRSTVAAATGSDSTFTYQFNSAATASKLRTYGRYVDANNNYRVELSADSTTANFFKVVGGTTTSIGTFAVPSDTDAHKLRFQVDGTNLKAKVWDADDTEPNTWTATTTDSSVTAAGTTRVQLARSTGGANHVTIDDWTHTNPNASLSAVASYDWDDDGHLIGEEFPGASSRDWTWVDGQLTGYSQTVPGANRTTTLTYDSSGRLATEATSGVTTTYGYDNAGQLLSATPSSGTASAWTYDNVGRRATQTVGAVTTTYGYDHAGELTSATPSTGTATTSTYDNAGRRLTDTTGTNTTTYGYDPAGRLTNLTLPNGDTQLRGLNPNGLPETVANTVSATTTTWTLDWDPDGDIDQLVALSQGSATTDLVSTTGAPRGVASKGADHTVLASDIHGSNINSTGAGVPRANSYNAYGAPTGTDTLSPKLGYRGELTLGPLLNLRARDYQPTTGAFTTTDPLNGVPGTTTLNNPYHYTDNNPLNLVDPTGLRPDDATTGCESALIPIVCEYHDEIITTAAIVLSVAVGVIAGPVILAAYGPILGGAISGAFGGMFSIADQLGRTGRIDTDRLLFDTSLGAVGGAAGGALAELLAPAAKAMSFGRARAPWSSPIANEAPGAAAQSSDDILRQTPRPTLFSRGGGRTNADVLSNGGGLPIARSTVDDIAASGGVGLDGVNVRILTGADDIRYLDSQGAAAFASDRTIHLGPAAFADEQTLLRTLAHERTHIYQQQIWRPGSGNLRQLEDAAYGIEDAFWEFFRRGGR